MELKKIKQLFIELYGNIGMEEISVFFSPGRVNLIGEHTDYNGGFVFPCALNFGTYLAIKKNNQSVFRFATTNFGTKGEVNIEDKISKIENHWFNYPLGVIAEFKRKGADFEGLDFLFSGEIPYGAGLSSSASIETVTAYALNQLFGLNLDRMELIKLCQRAENEFVGVNCGIMDQFAVTMGKKDNALFLNCNTLEYELVPTKMEGFSLIISNTNKSRELADSKYNERRSECEKAVELLSINEKIESLSDIDLYDLLDKKNMIKDPVIFKRARHVLSENKRVLDAIQALKANNLKSFGQLMNESHDSLKDDYEVTGKELDTLVEEARKIPGVLGSRMTGAGFGGCTISLVNNNSIEEFKELVGRYYYKETGLKAEFYPASVGDGVKELS